jgi:hypothetical protein
MNRDRNDVDRIRRDARHGAQTSGLLLIAFLVLALTLIRYWPAIHWSLR